MVAALWEVTSFILWFHQASCYSQKLQINNRGLHEAFRNVFFGSHDIIEKFEPTFKM